MSEHAEPRCARRDLRAGWPCVLPQAHWGQMTPCIFMRPAEPQPELEAASRAQDAAINAVDRLTGQVARLERENETLRKTIHQLTERLENDK